MKIRRRFQIGMALLLLGVLGLAALPVLAATLTLRVASVEAQSGGSIDVPIEAVGATGLGALHMELLYDAKVLTPDSVTRGSLSGSNALVDFNAGKPGRIVIGVVTLDAIKGDGALATVRFKVIGDAGSSSALTLDSSKAWESGTHAEVLVKTEAGKVTIGGGLPLWLFAAVAILVLLFLFIIFFLFMRRRRPALQPVMAQPAYYAPAPMPPATPTVFSAPPPSTLPGRQASPPLGLPERPTSAPVQPSSDAFKKVEEQYFGLKGRLSAGRLTHQQFEAAMKDLMIQDAQGRYWMLGVDSGKWFVHNGQTWVEGQPF